MQPKSAVPTTVDRDRISTWKKFTGAKMCDGCWSGCCTLPVEVSAADLIRLKLITEDEASSSLKKVFRKLHASGHVREFKAKTGIFILEQKNGRDCIYLDANRRCTTYETRPEVCRQFPKIGPRPGFCPQILQQKTQKK